MVSAAEQLAANLNFGALAKAEDLKQRIWQKGWTMYYPNGPEGPEYGVLRLAPTIARGWLQGRPFEFKL